MSDRERDRRDRFCFADGITDFDLYRCVAGRGECQRKLLRLITDDGFAIEHDFDGCAIGERCDSIDLEGEDGRDSRHDECAVIIGDDACGRDIVSSIIIGSFVLEAIADCEVRCPDLDSVRLTVSLFVFVGDIGELDDILSFFAQCIIERWFATCDAFYLSVVGRIIYRIEIGTDTSGDIIK